MGKRAIIGNKMYIPVKGGVWTYTFGDWSYRRFIANTWYVDIDINIL